MTSNLRVAFEEWCRRNCSGGADSSEWYWQLFRAGAEAQTRIAPETEAPQQHYGLGNCGCKECDWFRKHPQCRPESLGGVPKTPCFDSGDGK